MSGEPVKNYLSLACVLTAAMICNPVAAGPYADDLAKCLVSSTTKDDRESLVRWMFAAAAGNPAVATIASVSPEAMDQANKTTGTLFMKLVTETCKDQTKKALTFEGSSTIAFAFQVLGQAAAGEMFSSPEVKQRMAGLSQYTDSKKIEALTK